MPKQHSFRHSAFATDLLLGKFIGKNFFYANRYFSYDLFIYLFENITILAEIFIENK